MSAKSCRNFINGPRRAAHGVCRKPVFAKRYGAAARGQGREKAQHDAGTARTMVMKHG